MTKRQYLVLFLSICFVGVLIYFWGPVQGFIIELLHWVDGLGVWGPVVFVVIVFLSVPLVLPGFPFTLGAGFIFGLFQGVGLIVIGVSIGGVFSFLLGRYAFRDWAKSVLHKYAVMEHLESEVSRGGWKLIMFTRMIPLFPFKVSNYVFGCTRVRLRDYWIGNTIGIVPLTLTNVYAGTLASDLSNLGEREAPIGTLEWVFSFGVLVLAVVGLSYIARYAQRAMRGYRSDSSSE